MGQIDRTTSSNVMECSIALLQRRFTVHLVVRMAGKKPTLISVVKFQRGKILWILRLINVIFNLPKKKNVIFNF